MKKFLTSIACGIFALVSSFSLTGCDFIDDTLMGALELEEMRETVELLEEEVDSLRRENATLRFELSFSGGIIGGDNIVELNMVDRSVIGEGDAITVTDNAQVTINGGTYDGGQTPLGGAGNTAVWVNSEDAKVVINDGIFTVKGLANGDTGHVDLIYCSAGTIEINGGYFVGENDTVWLLNCKDQPYKDGKASIIVKGGTFVNFDPSNCLSEGENTNFVAEGFTVVSEEVEGVIIYKVVRIA